MVESRKPNSEMKPVARLHLVDLSGSEGIGKTGLTGLFEKGAGFISLSFHYLEHVIVCLNKRANGENIHVPYTKNNTDPSATIILADRLFFVFNKILSIFNLSILVFLN